MKIALQNLALYNEGTLLFKWIELPATEEELEEAFEEIMVGEDFYDECGNPMEEYMIGDWEFENDVEEELLKDYVAVYCNLEELNERAEWVSDGNWDDDDIDNAKLIHQITGCGIESALEDYVDRNRFTRCSVDSYVEMYVIERHNPDNWDCIREFIGDVRCYMSTDNFVDFIESTYLGDYEMRIDGTDEFICLDY